MKLFKLNAHEAVLYWEIYKDENFIVIRRGRLNGKEMINKKKVQINKSGRSLDEQIDLEIKSQITKKKRSGYTEEIPKNNLWVNGVPNNVMLAKTWDFDKYSDYYPVIVQPKLDGVRAMAILENDNIILRSRNNKDYDNLQFYHLIKPLKRIIELVGCPIDGELYSHSINFDDISGIMRTKNFRHEKSRYIEFHAFDLIIQNMYTEKRLKKLKKAIKNINSKKIKFVSYYKANNKDDILEQHQIITSDGYEGIMIRLISSSLSENKKSWCYYTNNRSDGLLKYKIFYDEEGIIIDVVDGRGLEEGLAIFKVRSQDGAEFMCRPKGTHDCRREWYKDKNNLIGKKLTYRFQEREANGKPRFPTAFDIRDYE